MYSLMSLGPTKKFWQIGQWPNGIGFSGKKLKNERKRERSKTLFSTTPAANVLKLFVAVNYEFFVIS
jgi:hypothetical protein